MEKGGLAFSPEVRRQQSNYPMNGARSPRSGPAKYSHASPPTQRQRGIRGPCKQYFPSSPRGSLFQKISSVSILSFFPGRNSGCLGGGDPGVWGSQLAKWSEHRWCWRLLQAPPPWLLSCVLPGPATSQPPKFGPDPTTHVGHSLKLTFSFKKYIG